jgi:hypothetical protein
MLSRNSNFQSCLAGAAGKALPPSTQGKRQPPKRSLGSAVSETMGPPTLLPNITHHNRWDSFHTRLTMVPMLPQGPGASLLAGSRMRHSSSPSPPTSTRSWTPTPGRPSKQVGCKAVLQRCATLAAGVQLNSQAITSAP